MLFEIWTIDSNGIWQSNSNCVFVALVMTTMVITNQCTRSRVCDIYGCQETHNKLIHSMGNSNTGKQQTNDKKETRSFHSTSSQQWQPATVFIISHGGRAFAQEICKTNNNSVFKIRCQRSNSIENNSSDFEGWVSMIESEHTSG